MSDTVTDRTSKEDSFASSNTVFTDKASNEFLGSIPTLHSQIRINAIPDNVPAAIFNQGLSGLESLVFYLKESHGLRFCQIASLLNRDDRTIWDSFDQARKKTPSSTLFLGLSTSASLLIPLSIFEDRDLGVLEALSAYLKETMQMRYCEIAVLLGKNDRTIWTAYDRAKKKRSVHHAS